MADVLRRWLELAFPEDVPAEPDRPRPVRGPVTLPRLGFFVESATSPSGRHRLAWGDGHEEQTKAGRRWEAGRWALLDRERVVHSGRLPRPNGGAVSDAGSAVIADWTTEEGLSGDVMFIDAAGQVSRLRRYAANLGSVAINGSGTLAAVSTLQAPSDDASLVVVWDLQMRQERWRRRIDRILVNNVFEFDDSAALLLIKTGLADRIALHLDGRVATDVAEYRAWLVATAAPTTVAAVARLQLEEWGALDVAQADELIAWLDGATQRSMDPDEQASLLRWMGEIAEGVGQSDKVIDYWRRAVALNPNVGVKQKLKKLDPTFATTQAAIGKLVAELAGAIAVQSEWKLPARATAIVHAGGPGFVVGLGQAAKGNLLVGDITRTAEIRRFKVPGYIRHVLRDGDSAWFVITTQGMMADGTTAIWRLAGSDEPRLLTTLGAVTTGPPTVIAAGIGVGCRDGRLYCVGRDGQLIWTHVVGAPAPAPSRRLFGLHLGFGSATPRSDSVAPGTAGERAANAAVPSPYHVTAGVGDVAVVYATGARVVAVGSDGKTRWQLGEPGSLDIGTGGLLVDAINCGPDGSVLIQRRNFRLTLRRPDGATTPLNPDGEAQRQLKGVDWLRNSIWAKDHEDLLICDLTGRTVHRRAKADQGWMWCSTLRADGERLAVWHDASVDIWDRSLMPIGSARFAGERLEQVICAGDNYLVSTNKRVALLEER